MVGLAQGLAGETDDDRVIIIAVLLASCLAARVTGHLSGLGPIPAEGCGEPPKMGLGETTRVSGTGVARACCPSRSPAPGPCQAWATPAGGGRASPKTRALRVPGGRQDRCSVKGESWGRSPGLAPLAVLPHPSFQG